jgi:hypothetical protein
MEQGSAFEVTVLPISYFCVTKHPHAQWLKTMTLYCHCITVSVIRNSGREWQFWLGVSQVVTEGQWLKLKQQQAKVCEGVRGISLSSCTPVVSW